MVCVYCIVVWDVGVELWVVVICLVVGSWDVV